MYINRHEGIIDDGDLPSKVRREQERQALADGTFVAPFLVAKKDCELFIKWKGDAGGLQQIRGEKVGAANRVCQWRACRSCPCPCILGDVHGRFPSSRLRSRRWPTNRPLPPLPQLPPLCQPVLLS